MKYHCTTIQEWTEEGRAVTFQVRDDNGNPDTSADGQVTVRGKGADEEPLKMYDVHTDYDTLPTPL